MPFGRCVSDYVGGGHAKRDCTGGWHDAGDYNKYVVNAAFTVAAMFHAWEDFAEPIKRISLNIPDPAAAAGFSCRAEMGNPVAAEDAG